MVGFIPGSPVMNMSTFVRFLLALAELLLDDVNPIARNRGDVFVVVVHEPPLLVV
jgi:hypothetical protein